MTKFDWNPCIRAAGKCRGINFADVKSLLYDVRPADEINATVTHVNVNGRKKEHSGSIYGVFTEIQDCLAKPLKTQFQCLEEDVKNSIYDSYWNKPLGRTRDQTPGLPKGIDIYDFTFGKPTKRDDSAADLINFKVAVSERCAQTNHNYSFSYGLPSNSDRFGSRIKRSITWFNNDPVSPVSRRQAAVRSRTLPPLGKNVDKSGILNGISADTTFGKSTNDNFDAVENLLHANSPNLFPRDLQNYLGHINKMRQIVQKKSISGELILEELDREFSALDKEKKCLIHLDCVIRICRKRGIPLERHFIEPLLGILGLIETNGVVSYPKFLQLIDINEKFPQLKRQSFGLKLDPREFRNEPSSTAAAGLPSLEFHKNIPTFKDSKVNMSHLGQETCARTLISPSIFTQYNLSHRDFFRPRDKEFFVQLMSNIGVNVTKEEMEEIFKKGSSIDRSGGVCIETFKNLLDLKAYKLYSL